MREMARKFYNSREWHKARQSYISHVHGLCERCGRAGKIVHHKTYITPTNINNPDITLNFNNLEFVCHDCHNEEHLKARVIERGLRFDEDGMVVSRWEKGAEKEAKVGDT